MGIDFRQIGPGLVDLHLFKLQHDQQQRQQQRGELQNRYHSLQALVQQYVTAGQNPPQDLLAALSAAQQELLGVGLPTQPAPAAPLAPTGQGTLGRLQQAFPGAGGTPTVPTAPSVPQYEFPGTGGLLFQTVGEMSKGLGFPLRPGVNPDLKISDLMRQRIDVMALFANPEDEKNQARQRAQQLQQTYPMQQILATPSLKEQFLKDFRFAYGMDFPAQQSPETQAMTLGGYGSPSEAIRAQAGQTIQAPTGRMVTEPILPQTGPNIVVDLPGIGKIPFSQLNDSAQTALLTRLWDEKSKVEVTLPNGQKVRVSPEKAVELANKQQAQMVTFKDPVSGATVTVPATAIPSFFPRRGPGGEVSTEGLTPDQKRIVDSYNRLVDQRTRLLDIISTSFDEDAKKRATQDISDLDKRIQQLQPQVDRILGIRGQTPSPGGNAPSPIAAQVFQVFQQTNQPVPLENWNRLSIQDRTWLQSRGVRSAAAPQQPSSPTVSGDVGNVIRATAAALKRQRVPWNEARLRILRSLSERKVNINDPNVQRAVDSIGQQVYRGR